MSSKKAGQGQPTPQQLPDYTILSRSKGRSAARSAIKFGFWLAIALVLAWLVLASCAGSSYGSGYTPLLLLPALAAVGAAGAARRGAAPPANLIVGEVRNFRDWTETQYFGNGQPCCWIVWTFTVERFDQRGSPLPLVPVLMRGVKFDGALREGDRIEVRRKWTPGETLHVGSVRNLTTGATVQAAGNGQWKGTIGCLVVLAIVVAGGVIFLSSLP